ncbi:MAG: DUF615 domain-containing protein [Ottowia sp.]|nr:DUF615 domain-containing protein [Ottowia sp.]
MSRQRSHHSKNSAPLAPLNADTCTDDEVSEKSKSQRKREMLALQKLAAELVLFSKERLATISLNDDLRTAIEDARNTRTHEGKRRQMQYLGKLMRLLEDPEVLAIRSALDAWYGTSKAHTAQLHHLEHWRDSLLADDAEMTRLLSEYPQVDAQALRTLVRNSRKERLLGKTTQHARALFRVLKQLLEPTR